MTASQAFAFTAAESDRFDRWRTSIHSSRSAKKVDLDEMIEVTIAQADRIERSCRVAEAAYRAPFDAREVRRSAVLLAVADLLGMVAQNKDAVSAALKPKGRRT